MSQELDLEKIYSNEDVLKSAVKYFDGDELAGNVWMNKYALKDAKGNFYELNPSHMHRRLASEIARIESNYEDPLSEDEVYDLIDKFKYIVPGGGNFSGVGNNKQIVSLSNCFVIGNEADSYGGIIQIDEEQVQLMKRRGGVGHDLTHIRPSNSEVLNSARTSTGIVPFMERYSNSTREVAQGGRRGALMLSLEIKHPDAENFIDAKMTEGKVTGANISVKIDDKFMKALKNGNKYTQQFPVNSNNPQIKKEINAKKLWNKIIHNAWKSAEPGVLFWDTIKKESIPDCYADLGFETTSTNPCGEIPLCPYDSCRLLSLNLYSYVKNPFTDEAEFDFPLFKQHAHYAHKIMDDIVDLEIEKIKNILKKIENDPEDEKIKKTEVRLWKNIQNKTLQGRRTGIGITAEGDMLAALNLRYGSEDSIDFSTKIHKTLAIEVYRSSVKLAKERGKFPIYDFEREKNNPFMKRIFKHAPELEEEMKEHGRRNISLLTVAPTGTTSLMTQSTSGIEPVFLPSYKRRRKVNPNDKDIKIAFVDSVGDSWEEYNVFHPKFEIWLKMHNYNISEIKKLNDEELSEIIKKTPYYKATSNDVDWLAKVKLQGSIQKWVDHSISVTINIPNSASEELVNKLYITGWKEGCKGITVYRDGSREGVLISNKKEEKIDLALAKRPEILDAEIQRFNNGDEKWVAFVGLNNGHPYEIFTGMVDDEMFPIPISIKKGKIIKIRDKKGNARYDFNYRDKYGYNNTIGGLSHQFNKEFWNYAKLISGVLRHGMTVNSVIDLIDSLNFDSEDITSWKAGVKRTLKRYIADGTRAKKGQTCSECDSDNLIYQEGCLSCTECGHSKCD